MTSQTKVHGMDGSLVKPDWPPLTLDELRELFQLFPRLGHPLEILSHSPRPLSAASVVRASQGKVFVKRHHHKVRDREGLLEEHRLLDHLRARGAAVAEVYRSLTGETAIERGEWSYELHSVPAGIDLYEEAVSWTPFQTAAHARSAGEALARLHRASEGFDAPARQPRPLVASFTIFASQEPEHALSRYLAERPVLASCAELRRCTREALGLLEPFHDELKPLLPALPPLWTQNDLHASNLFWSDAGPEARATAIVDFGLADRTCAVHDLAHAIERNTVEWLSLSADEASFDAVAVHLDHLRALLDGYQSARPLSAAELAALAPITALCHAEFALTEADYFLGVLGSPSSGALAYDLYLAGHARWFRSRAGSRLLDEFRRWASEQEGKAK